MKADQAHRDDRFDGEQIIPEYQKRDQLVFIPINPYKGYIYWNTQSPFFSIPAVFKKEKYLRIYDITETIKTNETNTLFYFDIYINPKLRQTSKVVAFSRRRGLFVAEYGYFENHEFIPLLRSNKIRPPAGYLSDEIDPNWTMVPEKNQKILLASGFQLLSCNCPCPSSS